MDTLPNELILIIFGSIHLITDMRNFLRVCKNYNLIMKKIFVQYEKNYSIKDFDKIDKYCVEKFTLELCHDGYFDKISESFIVPTNKILIKSLVYFNNIKLLAQAKDKGCYMDSACVFATLNGHLNILQWLRANGCRLDYRICTNAAEYGHLNVLQWARTHGYYWDAMACCTLAAKNGHLNVVEWIRFMISCPDNFIFGNP